MYESHWAASVGINLWGCCTTIKVSKFRPDQTSSSEKHHWEKCYNCFTNYSECLLKNTNIHFPFNRFICLYGQLLLYSTRSGGLQLLARISALYQEKTRISEVEETLPWNQQTHQNELKQKLLEESDLLHALCAYRETPDCCAKQVKDFNLSLSSTDGIHHSYIRIIRLVSGTHFYFWSNLHNDFHVVCDQVRKTFYLVQIKSSLPMIHFCSTGYILSTFVLIFSLWFESSPVLYESDNMVQRKRENLFHNNLFRNVLFFIPGQRGMSFTSKVIKWVLRLCLLGIYVSSPLTHKFQKDTVLGCVHSTQMQLKQCTPHVPKTMDIVANARLQNSKFTNCDL